MITLNSTEARSNLYGLIAEEDWSAINETLNLLGFKGMRESVIEGIKTPLSECSKDLEW